MERGWVSHVFTSYLFLLSNMRDLTGVYFEYSVNAQTLYFL